eukprot:COSAG01_NODE_5130_length_4466_cov_23.058621_2_plen_213_part_00
MMPIKIAPAACGSAGRDAMQPGQRVPPSPHVCTKPVMARQLRAAAPTAAGSGEEEGGNSSEWQWYPSASEAARVLQLDKGQIGKCCRGVARTTKGYEFKFASEQQPSAQSTQTSNCDSDTAPLDIGSGQSQAAAAAQEPVVEEAMDVEEEEEEPEPQWLSELRRRVPKRRRPALDPAQLPEGSQRRAVAARQVSRATMIMMILMAVMIKRRR